MSGARFAGAPLSYSGREAVYMAERAKNYEAFSERILTEGTMNDTMRLAARVGWLESERKRMLNALDAAMILVSRDPVDNLYLGEDGVLILSGLLHEVRGEPWVPWWRRKVPA